MSWAERRWDFYAPHYDRLISLETQRRRSLELAAIQPGERVLISGCGTGLDLPLLPAGVEIDAVDISPAMLEQARGKARGLDVRFQTMDAQKLLFADDTFDVVVLHLIVAIVPEPIECLREAARVVKRSGRVALFDKYFHGPGKPRFIRRLLNPVSRALGTDLNVRMLDLAEKAGLRVVHEEGVMLNGMFRVARLERQSR